MNNAYDAARDYYNTKVDGDYRTLRDAKLAYLNSITGRSDTMLEVAEMWFYQSGGDVPAPLPATSAVVANNSTRAIPVTGTYTNTVQFTVAGGQVTAITLS